MLFHQLVPADGVLFLMRRRQHQRGAGAQRTEQIEHRHVMVRRRDGNEDVVGGDRPALLGLVDDVGGGAVVEHHAFGLTGGAGGIQVVARGLAGAAFNQRLLIR